MYIFDINTDIPIEWCLVPAGDYTSGSGNIVRNIAHDYEIMKYEVNNAQYLSYLQEAYSSGDIWVSGSSVMGYYPGYEHWDPEDRELYSLGTSPWLNTSRISYSNGQFILNFPTAFRFEDYLNHPVVYVTWFGAWHFSNFYGWRLPTEQEWEKAVRGMTGYDYPWGNGIDGSRVNYVNSGYPYDNGTTPVGFYNGQTHAVNGISFSTMDSPSPYGVYDMAGNVWNFTDSFWSTTGALANLRVHRGGSWNITPYSYFLCSWYRDYISPTSKGSFNNGFRSARTLD